MRVPSAVVTATLFWLFWTASAFPFDSGISPDARIDQAAFAFGGRVRSDGISAAPNPFSADYEDNFVVGAGYQQFWAQFRRDLQFGAEVGIAGRFGPADSAELWGGLVARYDGIKLFSAIRISPSLTVGLSTTTGSLSGREHNSEIEDGGDAALLFYLGPELGISLTSHPDFELFWRVHHRSGAWGTLGDMHGAADAHVLGVRWRLGAVKVNDN